MSDPTDEHLTDYERAIYYYSLPRVTQSVPVGVLVIYAFIVLQTFVAMAYGARTEKTEWIQGGAIAFGICVAVGIGTYLFREFIHEFRERSAQAKARTIPDADSQFDDIPDPFADHVLLRYPIRQSGAELTVYNNHGQPVYTAEVDKAGKKLAVRDHEGKDLFNATLDTSQVSFSFETGNSPSRIAVEANGVSVGKVERKSNFGPANVRIECGSGEPEVYEFRGGGLYRGEALVGRIYEVRQHHYLDIHKQHFRDAILSFFITIG